jgi:hypothetical protein
MPDIDLNFKIQLQTHCLKLVRAKLNSIQIQIDAQKMDLNTTTKSSAGDKHETARAMIHLEQEKLGIQFLEAEKQLRILSQIKLELHNNPQNGTLLQTDKALFYISIGLGVVNYNGLSIYVISPISPLAQQFLKAQDLKSIKFNDTVYSVKSIV